MFLRNSCWFYMFQVFIEMFKNTAINTINWCDLLWYLKLACCFCTVQEWETDQTAAGGSAVSCLRLLPNLHLFTDGFFQSVSPINVLQIEAKFQDDFFFFLMYTEKRNPTYLDFINSDPLRWLAIAIARRFVIKIFPQKSLFFLVSGPNTEFWRKNHLPHWWLFCLNGSRMPTQ